MKPLNVFLLICILVTASCSQKQGALPSVQATECADTMALKVAVMPTFSCLPVYYAQRMGMFDSAGVKICLDRYRAQMDVDTTILRGHVHVAVTDLVRAIRLQNDSVRLSVLLAADEPLSMVAQKGKRIKKMAQMKERMVAVSRLSATDYWCQRMQKDAGMDALQLFRPQINDVFLRADMLLNGLIDAAMLPEPYATWTVLEGNPRVNQSKPNEMSNALWVAPFKKKLSDRYLTQLKIFTQVYRTAVEKLISNPQPDTLRTILVDEYRLPVLLADSIQLPLMALPHIPTEAEVEKASTWLSEQGKLPKGFSSKDFLQQ